MIRDAVTRADGVGGRKQLDQIDNGDFCAPLKTHLHPIVGQGVPTFSRATAAWNFNEDGKLVEIPSGCARFTGARMLYNFIPQSQNLSTGWTRRGSCTVTGGQTDPRGGTTAYQINSLGQAGINDIYNITNTKMANGRPLYIGFWIKRVSTTGVLRLSNSSGTPYGRCTIDLATLPDGWIYVDKNSPYVTVTTPFVVSNAKNVGVMFTENGVLSIDLMIWGITSATLESVNQSNAANEYVSRGVLSGFYHGAGADGVKFFDTDNGGAKIGPESLRGVLIEGARTNSLLQCRDLSLPTTGTATGVRAWYADSFGSELLTNGDFSGGLSGWTNISSGTGTATLSGGGVSLVGTDGSNRGAIEQYVTGLDTSKWYVLEINVSSYTSGSITMTYHSTSGTSSFDDYYMFASAGGVVRRMLKPGTSSIYVKLFTSSTGGNAIIDDVSFKMSSVNPTLNEIGIDGVANTCTTIIAKSDGGAIYQSFTMASAARTFSAYIKRKSGTGTISLTRNGGSTWTDVTSQITADKFTRVYIRNNSVTDPICGIRLGTAGDEIVVDCAQDEAGVMESTPIITTTATVTRNGDSLTYSSLNLHTTRNTVYHESIPSDSVGALYDRRSIFLTALNNNRAGYYYQGKNAGYGDGAGVIFTGNGNYSMGDPVRAVMRWENGSPGSAFTNGFKHTDTAGNVSVTPSTVDIGTGQSTSSVFMGSVKNVKIYKRLLTDEECINSTLLGVD